MRILAAAEISLPFLKKVAINAPVLGFTVAAAASRTDLVEDLKEGGREMGESAERGCFRAGLVVIEIALALATRGTSTEVLGP